MSFLYPLWFWAVIPCIAVSIYLMRRSRSQTLIAPHIAKAMGLELGQNKSLVKLFTLAWLLAIFGLAGPSLEDNTRPSMQGNDARVVVMDMSLSMYAKDVSPSRLDQARFKVADMLNLWTDGQTGLVVYSADAYSVAPLTRDSQSLLNHLPQLSPAIMPYAGARADKGVEQAISMLTNAGFQSGQIVLVIDDLSSEEKQAIESMLDGRWQLAILAVATENGAPIPLPDGGMLQTASGNTVVATSQFNNMNNLAQTVDGLFIPIQHTNRDVETITSMSDFLGNTVNEANAQKEITTWQNKGYWLILPIMALALLLFRRGVLFGLVMLVSLSQPNQAFANPWLNSDQQGFQAYQGGDYQRAQQLFDDPEWQGLSAYESGDYQTAIEHFSRLESTRASYNLGNAYAQAGDYDNAIEQYRKVLGTEPDHQDALDNLALVEQLKQQHPQDSESNSQDQSDSDEQQSQESQESQSEQSQQDDSSSSESENDGEQPQNESQPDAASDSNPQEEQQQQQQQQDDANSKPSEDDQQDLAQEAQSEQIPEQEDQQASMTPQELSEAEQQKEQDLRQLDRVEAARDPSRLIRAQLQLQAQQKPKPQVTEKNW